MNNVHDMGGMQGYGPVMIEEDEPLFHHDWEARALAITLAMGATGRWNIDQARSTRESLPAAQYLSISYYQIWFEALQKLLVKTGLVDANEINATRALVPPLKDVRVLLNENVAATLARGGPTERQVETKPRFTVGQKIRTRQMNPTTHTRLPRYCRDKAGTITAIHGAHVYPDTNGQGKGEHPAWLYTVSFNAEELWGSDTTASEVRVDCWEPYLMAATE